MRLINAEQIEEQLDNWATAELPKRDGNFFDEALCLDYVRQRQIYATIATTVDMVKEAETCKFTLQKMFDGQWYHEGTYTDPDKVARRAFELAKMNVYEDVRVLVGEESAE